MMKFLYEFIYFNYNDFSPEGLDAEFDFHVGMVSIADKYDIKSLQDQATNHIIHSIRGARDGKILATVRAVYNIEGVDELRVHVVLEVWRNLRLLLQSRDFEAYLQENGELGKDLAKKHIAGDLQRQEKNRGLLLFYCDEDGGCGLQFMIDLYAADKEHAYEYLEYRSSRLCCFCPGPECDGIIAVNDSFLIGNPPFNVAGWFKYICRSGLCKKVVYFNHNDQEERLEDSKVDCLCLACNSPMKMESNTGIMTLPDDNEILVEAMISFMYTFTYPGIPIDDPETLQFHVNLFTLADKYDVPRLRQLAVTRFTDALEDAPPALLIETIEAAFTTPPSGVQELRQAVINVVHHHLGWLVDEPSFQDVMDRNGELGRILLMKSRNRVYDEADEPGMVQFACSQGDCGLKFEMSAYIQSTTIAHSKFGAIRQDPSSGGVCSRCPICGNSAPARPLDGSDEPISWLKFHCPLAGCHAQLA
ncbi:hypothetical protein FKW77_001104 [Venturia effusa]|uniref:BTB domain-containing protein n=1 Tax=Venturia effusa TaxID=50376 RepID=A0A517LBV2_9PEZI|nr:hypothetical protein FKW77_001104 [Venturia effusa]